MSRIHEIDYPRGHTWSNCYPGDVHYVELSKIFPHVYYRIEVVGMRSLSVEYIGHRGNKFIVTKKPPARALSCHVEEMWFILDHRFRLIVVWKDFRGNHRELFIHKMAKHCERLQWLSDRRAISVILKWLRQK